MTFKLKLHENNKTLIIVDENGGSEYVTPEILPNIILFQQFEYIINSLTGNGKT